MENRNSKKIVHSNCAKRIGTYTSHSIPYILTAISAILISAGPAFAEKFRVRPMKIELTPRAGRTVERVLRMRNERADSTLTLDIALVELTQAQDGNPKVIEPGLDIDTSSAPSCSNWIKLSSDSVKVEPLGAASVMLTVKVPPYAHGFYIAGVTVQTKPRPETGGATIALRFLIPILIEIQGPPMRRKINLTDVGMEFRWQSEQTPATTLVSMEIANQGKTFSRLKGSAKVQNFSNGHWRDITTTQFKKVGIIPGVTLNLKSDIGRSLPSGKYRLKGKLYVDGRRAKPIEKEIDFVGDPSIKTAAADAALDLEPTELFINSMPGAMRTSVIRVSNASDSTVDIIAAATIPSSLRGVAFGELMGEDLSCAKWVKVAPERFTLRPGGQQGIRIMSKMPKAESMLANYYTNIGLWARYTDGQNAGVTTALVCLENKSIKAEPAVQAMKVTLAVEGASRYAIVGRFGNTGNVHIRPRCRAALITTGGRTVARILLAGESGMMLPLEVRDFSGVFDFSKIQAGTYRLEAVLQYTGGRVTKAIPIRVSVKDGQRVVEIIEPKVRGG